jgi:soluble lytic murein transglycosylase
MRPEQGKCHAVLSSLLLAVSVLLYCQPGWSQTDELLEQQRKLYLNAKKSLREGNVTEYRKTAASLKDYPLYPYLVYDYLRPRLTSSKDEEIRSFLQQYPDTLLANDLRQAWLKLLAQRNRWQDFLQVYTSQKDVSLQCYQLQARIRTNQLSDSLLEDTRQLWLAGKSQPDACNPAFDLLAKSPLMTSDLIWERIRLSMQEGEIGLASYLGRQLDKQDQQWVTRWVTTYQNPAKATSKPGYPDVAIAREILAHGVKRLASSDIKTAIARWEALKSTYAFDKQQLTDVERTLGIRAVIKKHPQARQYLASIDNADVDEELFHWRLRNALDDMDWSTLAKWTEGTPTAETVRLRWLYWRARALENTGQPDEARQIYQQLASERDYYGFLAADRISAPYNIDYQPLPDDPETWQVIRQLPGIKRARELFLTGGGYPSRREWNYTLQDMSLYHKEIAAALASEWGWHDRAILTLGQAQSYGNLVVRFPIAFEDKMTHYANIRKLDLGWVFALTRAESAFMVDAKSPSGALGLMQVMPATGKETANAIGMKNFNPNTLLDAEKNITIGTAYLKKVHDRFDNRVLATAAYNAGPNAVAKWLAQSDCTDPDVWIEKIPFTETRKYVSRIMFFATVYDWRLNNSITRVSERMDPIVPTDQNRVANLTCATSSLSQS